MFLILLSFFVSADYVALNNHDARLQANGDFHANLASLYKARRQFPLAVRHYRMAFHFRANAPAPELAIALNNLAAAMRAAGEENNSLQFREALRLLQRGGVEDLQLAVVEQNLGVALAESGRFREAVDLLRHSLALKTRLLGEDHPQVHITLVNLRNVERSVRVSAAPRNTVDFLELVRP